MTNDTPTSDPQEEGARNYRLWHNEFMDLRQRENFDAMQETYRDLYTDSVTLPQNDPQTRIVLAEMEELYPLYMQAYNYHHNREEFYRQNPDLNPPAVRVQSPTPPDGNTPAPSRDSPGPAGNPIDTTRLLPPGFSQQTATVNEGRRPPRQPQPRTQTYESTIERNNPAKKQRRR
ncbi:hypothetical protein GCM10009863_32750 [Streptomyces axinellae]|uniref:Uncharacterized protein n=1 Tax=Streptomyces axinellae TaxID=552788 RepID=A0ABN3Q4L0_9ACTN